MVPQPQDYVDEGNFTEEEAKKVIRTIEQHRGVIGEANSMLQQTLAESGLDGGATGCSSVSGMLSKGALKQMLKDREDKMRAGRASATGSKATGDTDQWHVYRKITQGIESGRPLRLMVQASAGTGKTFLLTTVALWCEVHELTAKASM